MLDCQKETRWLLEQPTGTVKRCSIKITSIIPHLLTSLLIFADFTQKKRPKGGQKIMDISTKLVEITPQLATEYLTHLYKFQRPEDKKQVAFLAAAMSSGVFDPTSSIAFADLKNGDRVLIDGQHTLKAIIRSNCPQKLLVSIYPAATEDVIARLYSHFNIGRSRTLFDSIRAHQVPAKTGLSGTQINQVAAAIRYIKAGFPRYKNSTKYQHEEMIKMVISWLDQSLLFYNTIEGCETTIRRRFCSAPLLATCLVILKYNPQKGVEFLTLVHDDGLKKGDPRKALLVYARHVTQHSASSGLRQQSPGNIARAAARCWGKVYDGLSLNIVHVKSLDSSKNIVIKGTPYTGEFPTVG